MNRLLLLVIASLTVVSLGACAKKNIRDTPVTPTEVTAKQDEGELFAVTPSGSEEGGLLGSTTEDGLAGGGAAEGGEAGGGTMGAPPIPSLETQGIEDVYFAFDSADLTAEGRTTLAKDAAIIGRVGGHYQIEGHCDERGSAEYNLALGDRRARAVRDYLVSLGVDPAALSTISYGEERPFAEGHDESAWSQNRRGHFVAQ